MYRAWVQFGILPSQSYAMTDGELITLMAFMDFEAENRMR